MKTKKMIFAVLMGIIIFIFASYKSVNTFNYSLESVNIGPNEGFTFYIVSDPHYLSDTLHDEKEAFQRFMSFGDRAVHYADEILDVLLEDIKRDKPDFLVFTGDLTCNGEIESHRELSDFLQQIEEEGTQVYVIPGNHDVLNPMARQFFENTIWETDYVTKDTFAKIYSAFGYEDAVSRDSASLSYMAKPSEDVWLLMLDTSMYKNNIKENLPRVDGELSSKTREWIENCAVLAQENDAELIAVMHHSLLDHSSLKNEGYTINDSNEVEDLFHELGIEVVLSGHIHIQDIKSSEKKSKTLYDIATSCLSVYPNQYGVMEYTPGVGFNYKTEKVKMEEYALANNITDSNLLNFQDYSRNLFIKQCCRTHNDCLSNMDGLTAEESIKANEVVSEMNLMYFAGYRNEELQHLVDSEGYEILKNVSPCFVTEYVSGMLNDEISNHNILTIPINK